MKTREELVEWLRDAYAMEMAMLLALRKQIDSEKVSQRMREQASIHYVETEGHAQAVAQSLKQLGAEPSLRDVDHVRERRADQRCHWGVCLGTF
jgi:ferritin-like metal-binding protein YciE